MHPLIHPENATGELVELDRAECLRLLATARIGRVVFTDAALPAAEPVAYLLDGEEVVFQAESGSTFAAATRDHVVAFEADRVDRSTRTGWSVLGVGRAYDVVEPGRLAELAGRLPPPWSAGRDRQVLNIPLIQLTGRRLLRSAAPYCSPSPALLEGQPG